MSRPRRAGSTPRRPRPDPIPGLEATIRQVASTLKRDYSQYRAQAPFQFRDTVINQLRRVLTPKKRRNGPRRTAYIDKAYRMWRDQMREIRRRQRRRITWQPIAVKCIEQFSLMSLADRRTRLRRLRNSVYNRSSRAWRRLKRRANARR